VVASAVRGDEERGLITHCPPTFAGGAPRLHDAVSGDLDFGVIIRVRHGWRVLVDWVNVWRAATLSFIAGPSASAFVADFPK
jgi:hypothetical protein